MRTRPHAHPCGRCGVKTECCGDVEQNYDGFPEWICREYHTLASQTFRDPDDFLCDGCRESLECEIALPCAKGET